MSDLRIGLLGILHRGLAAAVAELSVMFTVVLIEVDIVQPPSMATNRRLKRALREMKIQ